MHIHQRARALVVGAARRVGQWADGPSHPDLEAEFIRLHQRVDPYTMTSPERQYALWQAVRHVEARGLDGDMVECGVWRGGSAMLAAATLKALGSTERTLWLYDTFAGMSEPTEFDVSIDGSNMAHEWESHRGDVDDPVFAYGSLDEVRRNVLSSGYPADHIQFVEGKVEDTIPGSSPESIALLRLDTDWYESTRHELEHLWGRLVSGGVLIIDDYGHWEGARRAVDEFFADREDGPLLNRIDYTGRIAVKA